MRKVSAHGLGHLSAPYNDADAPANFPIPHKSVLRDGTLRWHCDLWHQIVISTLAGHPDRVARDYHSALNQPAISRYAATSPDLLRWFKSYNAGRPYREQVKPFGFLLSLREPFGVDCEPTIAVDKKGRRKKRSAVKPIAPFENDHRKAVALAFDRDTGAPVPAASLCTYADALAQYHISPESKFLNGDYLDRGKTRRRHIRMATVQHIGKESHDWERQAITGMDDDSEISYGISASELAERLKEFAGRFGHSEAANALAISDTKLKALVSSPHSGMEKTTNLVASRLATAVQLATKRDTDQRTALLELLAAVNREGLRPVARRLGVDPSNLRRKLGRFTRLGWTAEACALGGSVDCKDEGELGS